LTGTDVLAIDLGGGTNTLKLAAGADISTALTTGSLVIAGLTDIRVLSGAAFDAGTAGAKVSADLLNGQSIVVLGTGVNTGGSFTDVLTVQVNTAGTYNFSGVTFSNTLTTGAGGLAITGSAQADNITGSAGNDIITGGVGADTLTGGAGADTFVFALGATGTPTATNFDRITDWGVGAAQDVIDVFEVDGTTQLALTLVAEGTLGAGQAAIAANGLASFNDADTTLAQRLVAVEAGMTAATAAAGETAVFVVEANSYVFISDGVAGLGVNDVLIELTGVVATGLTQAGGNITAVLV
jgi:Ca2+-binding RTX toxin-like protein